MGNYSKYDKQYGKKKAIDDNNQDFIIASDDENVDMALDRILHNKKELSASQDLQELCNRIYNVVYQETDYVSDARKMYLAGRDKHYKNIKLLNDLTFDRSIFNESMMNSVAHDDQAVKEVLHSSVAFSYFEKYSAHKYNNIAEEIRAKDLLAEKMLFVIDNLTEEEKKMLKDIKHNIFNEADITISWVINIFFSEDGERYETVEWLEKILKLGIREFDKPRPNSNYDTLDNFITYITDYDFTERDINHFLNAIRRTDLYDLLVGRHKIVLTILTVSDIFP